MIYRMTNEDTGEVITGTEDELKEKMNISDSTLQTYSYNGSRFLKCWKVEKVEKVVTEPKKSFNVSDAFWQEWLKVTRTLRKVFDKNVTK